MKVGHTIVFYSFFQFHRKSKLFDKKIHENDEILIESVYKD